MRQALEEKNDGLFYTRNAFPVTNKESVMKKLVSTVVFGLTIAIASSSVFGDSIINTYTCKLKEGKTKEELQAANSKWLKWVRANVNAKIESAVGTQVVGDQGMFLFADTYPDLATWAATAEALDSDAANELDDLFKEISECSQNRLWKFEPTP